MDTMNNMNSKHTLTEKEMMEDGLSTEKQLLNQYSIFIAEATDQNLRNQLQQIMTETQQMQYGIFYAMQSKGWYQIKNAPLSEVGQTISTMQQVHSQMS